MFFFYDVEAGTTSFEPVDEILTAAIQMKATEQYFSVVLFIMLYEETGDSNF